MRRRSLTLVALTVLAVAGAAAPAVAAPSDGTSDEAPALASVGSCAELRNNRVALARAGVKKAVCAERRADTGAKSARSASLAGLSCEPVSTEWTVPQRKVGCRSSRWFLNIHELPSWVIIGSVVMREIENVSSLAVGAAWTHEYRLEWERAWGAVAGAWVQGAFTCQGECSAIAGSIPATLVDRPVTLSTTGQFFSHVWPGSTATGVSVMEMSFHPGDGGGHSAFGDSSPPLRCDAIILPEGCVFPHQIPVFHLSGRGPNGEFVRHVALAAQSTRLGVLPGRPLTRTMDQSLINRNRATACPWYIPRPEGKSCDEYPFASTREGAAAFPHAGRTFAGCAMDHLPPGYPNQGEGWSACMIDERQNSSGGWAIGDFYGRERVLDGDQFLVFVS